MVSKKAIVGLAAIGLLAYAFVSRPKVVATRTQFEPIPVPAPVPEPVPFPVPVPLSLENALARVKEQFGDIYTKSTQRVRKDYQITLGADRYKWIKNFENITKEVKL
jgi:hypothetical protein